MRAQPSEKAALNHSKLNHVMHSKVIQATATAVLFATMAMPAFAGDGDHDGRGNGLGIFASLRKELRLEHKSEMKELKQLIKDARRGHKDDDDEDEDDEQSVLQICLEAAAKVHAEAVSKARQEKKAAYSAADKAYHVSLKGALTLRRDAVKAALNAFKASDIGDAAQATFVAAHVKAHADFNATMKTARELRSTTKATAEAKFIAAKAKADADLKAAKEKCRQTTPTPAPTPGTDTVVPSTLNLSLSGATASSVLVSWLAPGDDGSAGTAASYDLRYATSPIVTAADFAAATQVSGEPTPAVSGTSQSMTVSGLLAGTTYHFAAKATDDAGNLSAMSNIPSLSTLAAADVTAPAAIGTLTLSGATASSILLTWIATGDDGLVGTAASYDIRFSASPIVTAADFTAATQVSGEPSPAVAGLTQTLSVTGLNASTTYYFAIKVLDEAGNASAMTTASLSTLP